MHLLLHSLLPPNKQCCDNKHCCRFSRWHCQAFFGHRLSPSVQAIKEGSDFDKPSKRMFYKRNCPMADKTRSARSSAVILVARRPIAPGEELTLAYCGLPMNNGYARSNSHYLAECELRKCEQRLAPRFNPSLPAFEQQEY